MQFTAFPISFLVLHLNCLFLPFDTATLSSSVFFPIPGKQVSEEPLQKANWKWSHLDEGTPTLLKAETSVILLQNVLFL